MAFFSEYLDQYADLGRLHDERKAQLKAISELRGGDLMAYCSDLNDQGGSTGIEYGDLSRFHDQLSNLDGDALNLILETPGGSGEVAEDLVTMIRNQFDHVSIIVPGWCKSAGTLVAMAGDEILMDPNSGLGPIDAQIHWQGKVFSADELMKGLDAIKDEVDRTQVLNKAYIPILPGSLPRRSPASHQCPEVRQASCRRVARQLQISNLGETFQHREAGDRR